MPEIYHDRGLMKWQPFDALVGYGSMIQALKRQKTKATKPELSEDAYAALD